MNEGAMGSEEQRRGRVVVGGLEDVTVGEVERALRKMKVEGQWAWMIFQ